MLSQLSFLCMSALKTQWQLGKLETYANFYPKECYIIKTILMFSAEVNIMRLCLYANTI